MKFEIVVTSSPGVMVSHVVVDSAQMVEMLFAMPAGCLATIAPVREDRQSAQYH